MDCKIINRLFLVIIIFTSTQLKAVEFKGKFLQGHYIIGLTNPTAKIIIGKKEVKVSKEGYFVFGIDRDRKFDLTITKIKDGKKEKIIKKVLKRKYNIQRIDGLEESKVTPPESVYKRIKEENNKIGKARAINSDLPFFKNQFIMPVEGIISGVYGSQRILNGKPKSPHRGLDIANDEGTPVLSSNDGIVILAEPDLYYTGGTIVIDHGHGVKSIYAHLASVDVELNSFIEKRDIIGTVGSTGRSTGPHLHWGVMVFDTYIDPQLLLIKSD